MSDLIIINGTDVPTLVAITEEEQVNGLMHRLWPPPVMAFPFEKSAVRKFWMKNTPSPLDIIFCKANRVVDICRGEPYSESLIGPNKPTDLVIEMPAGQAKNLSIEAGNEVKLKLSVATVAKQFIGKYAQTQSKIDIPSCVRARLALNSAKLWEQGKRRGPVPESSNWWGNKNPLYEALTRITAPGGPQRISDIYRDAVAQLTRRDYWDYLENLAMKVKLSLDEKFRQEQTKETERIS